MGKLDGRKVTCPVHRMKFDVTTGCFAGTLDYAVASYPVKVVRRRNRGLSSFERENTLSHLRPAANCLVGIESLAGAVAVKEESCIVIRMSLIFSEAFCLELDSALAERSVRASASDAIRFPARQGTVFANGQRALSFPESRGTVFALCHVGEFRVRDIPDVLVLGVGGLLMAVMLSKLFVFFRRTTGG